MKLDDFIVCEDVRLEVSGLMTLVGFFAGALRIPTPGNLKLSFVMVMSEMKGTDRFLLQIETKLGKEALYRSGVLECRRDPAVDSHTIVHTINPFKAPGPGKYDLRVTVEAGGQTHAFSKIISLDIGPLPAGK
jgi:hypothetical protein